MIDFLALRFSGFQSWGSPTATNLRPTYDFPTLSGLVGFIGCCIGLPHGDHRNRYVLNSITYDVRRDEIYLDGRQILPTKCVDFKTNNLPKNRVCEADYKNKKLTGDASNRMLLTHNEFLCDSDFTVLIRSTPNADLSLEYIEAKLKNPLHAPCLGRACYQPSGDWFLGMVQASNVWEAFQKIPSRSKSTAGLVMTSFEPDECMYEIEMRDVPFFDPTGQKDKQHQKHTRKVWVSYLAPKVVNKNLRELETWRLT